MLLSDFQKIATPFNYPPKWAESWASLDNHWASKNTHSTELGVAWLLCAGNLNDDTVLVSDFSIHLAGCPIKLLSLIGTSSKATTMHWPVASEDIPKTIIFYSSGLYDGIWTVEHCQLSSI